MMVTKATMQRPRMASDNSENFSLFFTPFQMLALVSMVLPVCGKPVCYDNGSTVVGTAVMCLKFRRRIATGVP